MLIFGLVLSSVVLLVTTSLGRLGKYGWAGWLQVVFFFGPVMCMIAATPVLLQAVSLAALALIASSTGMRPGRFNQWAWGLTIGAIVVSMGLAWNGFQRTLDRRKDVAFESLDPGLGTSSDMPRDDGTLKLSAESFPEVFKQLAWQEEQIDSTYRRGQQRAGAIRRLHENTVSQFINSPGFGVTRMAGYDRYLIRTEDPGPIPQPQPPEQPYVPDDLAVPTASGGSDSRSQLALVDLISTSVGRMHQENVVDFVNPEGYGYRNRQGLVAGFEAHRFSRSPSLGDAHVLRLGRVELVSLLKNSRPRVYVSEHLPRMEDLRDAPTRDLTAFERDALARLRQGEDLVTRRDGTGHWALGSLRAMKQCLDCHQVRRGDLLGAFTYELRSNRPLVKAATPDA